MWEEVLPNNVGGPGGQGCKTFPDSVSSLFRELPEGAADAEVEWQLYLHPSLAYLDRNNPVWRIMAEK